MMPSSAKSQVSTNFGFALIKAVSLILSIRIADALLSAQILGLILLLRRQATLWANLIQLGLSQSLKRFYIVQDDPVVRNGTWIYQIKIGAYTAVIALAGGMLFSQEISALLFGTEEPLLGIGFTLLAVGIAVGYYATSSWLAEFKFIHSNVIEWLNGSVIFMVCLLFSPYISDYSLVILLGGLTLVASLLFLFRFRVRYIESGVSKLHSVKTQMTVLTYSLTRCFTAFCEIAIFVVGPWLLRDNLANAGYLILAYTFLKIAQTLVNPVAKVLALRAGSHKFDRVFEEKSVLRFSLFSFACSWLVVLLYLWSGGWLLEIWLPQSWQHVHRILDTLIYFVPAVSLYYCLRTHIELKYQFPWNLFVLLAALSVLIGFSWNAGGHLEAVVRATAAMLTIFYAYGICFMVALSWSQVRDNTQGKRGRTLDE